MRANRQGPQQRERFVCLLLSLRAKMQKLYPERCSGLVCVVLRV